MRPLCFPFVFLHIENIFLLLKPTARCALFCSLCFPNIGNYFLCSFIPSRKEGWRIEAYYRGGTTMQTKEERKKQYKQETYISAFEPGTLIPGILIAFLVGAVCMNIIGKLGTTPNTSLLGAIVAMLVARIPPECLSEILQSGAPELASDHCIGSWILCCQLRLYRCGHAFPDGGGLLHSDDGHRMYDRHLGLYLHHRPHL